MQNFVSFKKCAARHLFYMIKARLFDELGGDKRDRTADLLNAIQTLSQLSYTPMNVYRISDFSFFVKMKFLSLA